MGTIYVADYTENYIVALLTSSMIDCSLAKSSVSETEDILTEAYENIVYYIDTYQYPENGYSKYFAIRYYSDDTNTITIFKSMNLVTALWCNNIFNFDPDIVNMDGMFEDMKYIYTFDENTSTLSKVRK